MTARDSHSSSPDPSLVSQVEALIEQWRKEADERIARMDGLMGPRAYQLRECADQLQPFLVLLVEQQRKDLASRWVAGVPRESAPAGSTAPGNELASALCQRLRRWASILSQPCPPQFVRFYGDDDYAAMARAFSDAARAVETADNEVSSLVEAAVAKAREAQGTHEDPAFPDGENIELQQRLVEQQQKTEQEKP